MHESAYVTETLSKLSLDQKISLLAGLDFWHTASFPEHDVPRIRLSDGSSGVRGTRWFEGVRGAAIPCGTALAATWDRSLLRQAGVLLGNECRSKGVHCWLGPTVNIQRSPLGGRGYESYSEDPHLTGVLASEIVAGCEETGVIAAIKHLVCNDQENGKRGLNAIMTERALREIYLRPFQIVARDAPTGALMASYNKVNGVHVSESRHILQDIIRNEWKWDPLIMSDWYGTYSTVEALNAGLDLEMPGETMCRGSLAKLALSSNLIKSSTLDTRAAKVLSFIQRAKQIPVAAVEGERNFPEDQDLNKRLAQNSIVLLKNEQSVLPVPRTGVKKIALIGSHMKDSSVNSSGATALEPYYTIHPYEAIRDKLHPDTECVYQVGAYSHKMMPLLNGRLVDGMQLRLFNGAPWVASDMLPPAVGEISMSKSFFQLLDYVNPDLNKDTFFGLLEGNFTPDESGEWEFGLAVYGIARFYLDNNLVIDQFRDQQRGDSFFRRGTVEKKGTLVLDAGQAYKLRIEFGNASQSPLSDNANGSVDFGGGGARLGGCRKLTPKESIDHAVHAAKDSDYAVICTGLSGEWETEGLDRSTMSLPPHLDDLIAQVAEVCPRTIVVHRSGMPVSMPWASRVPSIVQAWYGGNETGTAIADVLFGDFNPCGKLPITWPKKLSDNPAYLNFGDSGGRVLFGEDVYVGYRWYDATRIEPLWPFGHGLSFTRFEMRDAALAEDTSFTPQGKLSGAVRVTLQNTGNRAGAEVLQLYVSAMEVSVPRPCRELHGFSKAFLQPGEKASVTIGIDPYAMSFWDEKEDMWCVQAGTYRVSIVGTACLTPELAVDKLIEVKQTVRWSGA